MAYNLIRTDALKKDLGSVLAYLSRNLGNPIAAASLLEDFEDVLVSLRSTPRMYPALLSAGLAERGYRKALVKNYVLIFKVDEDGKTVYLLRLFHASQDYAKLL